MSRQHSLRGENRAPALSGAGREGSLGWGWGAQAGLELRGLGRPPEPRHLKEGMMTGVLMTPNCP